MPVRPYEVVYIIDPDVNEENTGAMVERFRALAEAQGAEDLRVDTQQLGRRRLAYEIDHKREGQYVVMNFQSEANAPAEMERVLKITDGVLRSLVIRLEEMPPMPVAPPPAAAAPAEAAPAEATTEEAPAEAATEEAATPAPQAEVAAETAVEESAPVTPPADDEEKQGEEPTEATEPAQPAS